MQSHLEHLFKKIQIFKFPAEKIVFLQNITIVYLKCDITVLANYCVTELQNIFDFEYYFRAGGPCTAASTFLDWERYIFVDKS